MKILYTNPFGDLSNWTHRMGIMRNMLADKGHTVWFYKEGLVYEQQPEQFITGLKNYINKYQPDVILVHGSTIASHLTDLPNVVVDLGSFVCSEYLVQKCDMDYRQIRYSPAEHLLKELPAEVYEQANKGIVNAQAVLVYEGWEHELATKLFPDANIIAHSPLYIFDNPGLPFEEREDRAIAVASKWYRKSKYGKFIFHYNNYITDEIKADPRYQIYSIGHNGNWIRFMEHQKLMELFKTVKTVVFPMWTGGNATQIEALKSGCNVIINGRHPFRVYNNEELVIDMSRDYWSRTYNLIKRSYDQYYPPKPIPSAATQINKLIEILEGACIK